MPSIVERSRGVRGKMVRIFALFSGYFAESFLLVYWRSKITFKARRVCSVLDYSEIIDIVADNHYGDAFHIRTSDQVLALKATTNRHMVEWIAELMTVKNWNPLKSMLHIMYITLPVS